MQFQAMPIGTSGSVISAKTDPNALHVLLRSPNLPLCNIVFDGEKYWFYNPSVGWNSRKEFKGHIPTLHICPAYSACTAELPFKVRNIKDDSLYENWEAYLKTL